MRGATHPGSDISQRDVVGVADIISAAERAIWTRRQHDPVLGVPPVDILVIVAEHQAEFGIGLEPGYRVETLVDGLGAKGRAGLDLLLLVAVDRIDEKWVKLFHNVSRERMA